MDAHVDGESPRPVRPGTPVPIRSTGFHIPNQSMDQLR